jgi:hypothetical protein
MAENKSLAPESKPASVSNPAPASKPAAREDNRPESVKAYDAKPLGGPNPQGNDPKFANTAEGVTPYTQNAEEIVTPWPGPDHEAVLRAAKVAGTAGALGKEDDELEEIGQKVAEARALVDQRNRTTDGNRVKEIDNRLNELGFANPVATTEAQRRGLEPLGRREPGASSKA